MPAKILVVGNNKGGVGKTFVSKSIAEYAALIVKLKVLLLDLDPQTNLSRRYLDMDLMPDGSNDYAPPRHPAWQAAQTDDWNGYSDTADVWLTGFALPYPTQHPRLEIIPSHARKLQGIELVREQSVHEEVVRWLRAFLHLDEIRNSYDLVIIDTRPSKGPLVQAAMYAASHLLVPSEMEAPSVEGLHGMLSVRSQTNLQRPRGDHLELVGVLPNKVRKGTRIHDEFLALLREDAQIGPVMLKHALNDWVGYKESMVFGAPSIFAGDRTDRLRHQLEDVCREVLERLGFGGAEP